jgi:hypothetical protein
MKRIVVPVKDVSGTKWGDLSSICLSHEVIAEKVELKEFFTFAGQHRVRLVYLKKNVHWKIPAEGQLLDIAAVSPDFVPPRKQGKYK